MTQKEIIKKFLESIYPNWIREFEVHRINTPFGFIGPRGERDIREMLADGIIEGKLVGKHRWVRAKPAKDIAKPISKYRPEVEIERRIRESQDELL